MPTRVKNKTSLFDEVGITAPHRFIAADIQWFETQRQSASNKPWLGTMWTPLRCRMLRIQDVLLKAIEKRADFRIEARPENIFFIELIVKGERLRYSIGEYVVRSKAPFTKEDLRKAVESGKKARRKTVETPTGRLFVSASGVYRGMGKGSWSDEEGRPLEEQIDMILDGFEAVVAEPAAQRAKDDEEARQAEAKRAERRRSRRVEDDRWEALEETMTALERADRLRRFVDRIAAYSPKRPDQEQRIRKWSRWAMTYIDMIDPMKSGLDGVLARLGLPK